MQGLGGPWGCGFAVTWDSVSTDLHPLKQQTQLGVTDGAAAPAQALLSRATYREPLLQSLQNGAHLFPRQRHVHPAHSRCSVVVLECMDLTLQAAGPGARTAPAPSWGSYGPKGVFLSLTRGGLGRAALRPPACRQRAVVAADLKSPSLIAAEQAGRSRPLPHPVGSISRTR